MCTSVKVRQVAILWLTQTVPVTVLTYLRPEGMVTFDTQKLFVGYQLEQMDAAAAASALQDLLARRKSQAAATGAKPTTLELVDQYDEAQEEDSEEEGFGVSIADTCAGTRTCTVVWVAFAAGAL